MKDPIPPEHYYIPRAENDPVREEVHRIFNEAVGLVKDPLTRTVEQIKQILSDHIEHSLNDNFTSRHARPTSSVELIWIDKRPLFMICAIVYGHSFGATVN